jgi:hypothetical protein
MIDDEKTFLEREREREGKGKRKRKFRGKKRATVA